MVWGGVGVSLTFLPRPNPDAGICGEYHPVQKFQWDGRITMIGYTILRLRKEAAAHGRDR